MENKVLDIMHLRPFSLYRTDAQGLEYRFHYHLASYDRSYLFLLVTAIDYTTSRGEWRTNDTPFLITTWAHAAIRRHFLHILSNYCQWQISIASIEVMTSNPSKDEE
jgi:hypothetical protein